MSDQLNSVNFVMNHLEETKQTLHTLTSVDIYFNKPTINDILALVNMYKKGKFWYGLSMYFSNDFYELCKKERGYRDYNEAETSLTFELGSEIVFSDKIGSKLMIIVERW